MNQKKFDQLPVIGTATAFIKPSPHSEFNWPESEEFKNFVDHIGNDLKEITLTGGEPTIIPYVVRLLDNITHPEKVRLMMITNANSVNPQLLEILKRFKHVNITISLEGIEEHNDQIRFNSDWDRVVENIQRYKEISKISNVVIKINHVLQAFSVTTLIPLIEWTEKQGLELRLTPLFSPPHLALNSVPPERIKQFALELEKSSNPAARYALKELANHAYNPSLEQARHAHVGLLDEIRKTKLSQLI